uniref:neuronal pentraxin receptor isoform X2 n=1 Tax=Podarcis muralis TaxID=64176 RepID=UPI00109F2F05|nr:neuronal pentraxin receptor isoform X2 [Podarcis muralis]
MTSPLALSNQDIINSLGSSGRRKPGLLQQPVPSLSLSPAPRLLSPPPRAAFPSRPFSLSHPRLPPSGCRFLLAGVPLEAATLKFLVVLLAAGMLAFLGAIICIIASVYPAAGGKGALQGADNGSNAAAAALLPASGSADKTLGALHGAGESPYGGFSAGPHDALLDLLASARPQQHQQLFSRFLCTPLTVECPSEGSPQGDSPGAAAASEELLFLQSTAEQLRLTAQQQKDQILIDQETIRELTTKLSRCENGLELSFQDSPSVWGVPRQDTMGDLPWDSPAMIQELEEAVRSLKDRIDKIEDIPARMNATSAPVPAQETIHNKMEELEEQILSKILALEKDRPSVPNNHDLQQQDVEKELDALQNRVTELEHETTAFNNPEAFKVTIPVRNNYMYARMKKSLPELYAFTVCMWLKSKGPAGVGTPFSYSVPGQSNELVLLEWGNNPMELIINDKVAQLPMSLKSGMWHHICLTWITRDGIWSAYENGEERGAGDNLASWHPVKPHGVIILGQEQDALGGRFDATQAFVGEISQFNMWDHVLTPAEILGLANCTAHLRGNIIHWDEKLVEVHGGAAKWSFDVCEERMKA